MKLKNTFIGGKMNKDIDERLLPKGQYPHAENIRVANSSGSDIGAVENTLGNEKLTSLNLVNGVCIGAFSDDNNELIYWFVTSDNEDMILEYNTETDVLNYILRSTSSTGTLNFNKDYLITGVNKIYNEDPDKDLLFWTDDLNPPRVVNISRYRGSALGSFTQEDISVIKKPPLHRPELTPLISNESSIDSLEDVILAFAYRYVYLDGERSVLSSFSNYQYSPSVLNIDLNTVENLGMKNTFNAINVNINSGGKNVKAVELVIKQSNSNAIYLVEEFDKINESINDDTIISYTFLNDKTYRALSEKELLRTYDNVPTLAKAQDYVGNRIMYGNFKEGFDIKDENDNEITMNYSGEIISESLDDTVLLTDEIDSFDKLTIDFTGFSLVKGTRLNINLYLNGIGDNTGVVFTEFFTFIVGDDYNTLSDMFNSTEFSDFITVTMTSIFNNNETSTPPLDTAETERFGFTYTHVGNVVTITSPYQEHKVDNTPLDNDISDDDFTLVTYNWGFTEDLSNTSFNLNTTRASIKTNRNLEIGVIYLDEYYRKSTVLLSKTNTINVPQSLAESQNKLKITLDNKPPKDAVAYKFVVKQNKNFYENIFAPQFFPEDQFVWVKLEQSNKDKVKTGDTLYVKRDTGGVLEEPVRVTVLEVTDKEYNFIPNNFFNYSTGQLVGSAGTNIIEILEPQGVYMKIKPIGFNMNYSSNTFLEQKRVDYSDGPKPTVLHDMAITPTDLFPITQGAVISIRCRNNVERTERYSRFDKEYVSSADYLSFKDWFLAEVGLGTILFDSSPDAGSGIATTAVGDDIQFESYWFGGGSRRTCTLDVKVTIRNSNGLVVFETVPETNISEIYYETSETFEINNGFHLGKEQAQTPTQQAVHTLDFFNCYAMGDGVESISYLDVFNKPYVNSDLRPSSTSIEKFSSVRRFADLTYSNVYNEGSSFNGLNEFNLAEANFKDDIDKKYGSIQRVQARDTDIIIFQEDKVSKILYGKDLLMNADGSSNVASISQVLGQQITYKGEYGISKNPESFCYKGYNMYFTDVKRGAVLRLGNDGLTEINEYGFTQWFKDEFNVNQSLNQLGGFDPYYDQYIIHTSNGNTMSFDEKVKGFTSFFSYEPEYMIGLNNNFFSFKNGDLYQHHSNNVDMNTFYGIQYPSKVSIMVNDEPSTIKELQAVSLEGNYAWDTLLTAYVSNVDDTIISSISEVEYVKKEGIWYAYARRNEDNNHLDSKSTYGIGTVISNSGNEVIIQGVNQTMSVGDVLINNNLLVMGTITNIDVSQGVTTVTLDTTPTMNVGDFMIGTKNPRIEGGNLRGYTMRFDLTLTKDDKIELFAVNSEIMKSYT